ncbi:hypothetical protein [Gordonia otitidis]|uniref:hypothetical protein n=1 Tax=Gordonia otitidis TaxID=249058 RepID=UPI000301ADE9|nr:hypothetical protein [Gordonia otitidis]
MTDTESVPPCGDADCQSGHCLECHAHIIWRSEAWGDAYNCDACGYHRFVSIGD